MDDYSAIFKLKGEKPNDRPVFLEMLKVIENSSRAFIIWRRGGDYRAASPPFLPASLGNDSKLSLLSLSSAVRTQGFSTSVFPILKIKTP